MRIKVKSKEKIEKEFAASHLALFRSYTCGLWHSDIALIEGKWFVVIEGRASHVRPDYHGWVVPTPDVARYLRLFIVSYLVEEIEEDED